MKVNIDETNEIKTLNLYEIGSKKNIAKQFIKETVGIDACGESKTPGKKIRTLTEDEFQEWTEILCVAQSNIDERHIFLKNPGNCVHPLIQEDLESIKKEYFLRCRNKIFAIKDAVKAEAFLWRRLNHGVVSIKHPINNQLAAADGDIVSKTLEFTHFKHKKNSVGDDFSMQIKCDFTMTMPNPKESFDFTAIMELNFDKVKDGEIEFIGDEWMFPFGMKFEQELVVTDAFRAAAIYKFHQLGIEGAVSF